MLEKSWGSSMLNCFMFGDVIACSFPHTKHKMHIFTQVLGFCFRVSRFADIFLFDVIMSQHHGRGLPNCFPLMFNFH